MGNRILIFGLFLLGIQEAVQDFSFIANYDGSRQTHRRHLAEAVQHLVNTDWFPESLVVTFVDPDMFVWSITSVSSHDINDVYVKCRTMTWDGIRHPLQTHRPENPVWVFTDSPPRDPNQQYEEVVELIQKMGYQVFFVIYGPCYNNNKEAYTKYRDVALATNGQVFFIQQSEFGEIADYVQDYREYPKDIIISATIQPDSLNTKFNVTFDQRMIELTISATGDEPVVTVTGPDGLPVDTTDVIRLKSVTMVKLSWLSGVYQVEVRSKSETHVLVSASTPLTFQHAFSSHRPADFNDTARLPKPSTPHVSIMVQNSDKYVELRSIQILDMEYRVLDEQPLELVDTAATHFYTTELISIPEGIFQIAIILFDHRSGTIITRHGLTPIAPETARCRLPLDRGDRGTFVLDTPRAYLSWYYNTTSKEDVCPECRCQRFSYAYNGHSGNYNRFNSAEECRSACGGPSPSDTSTKDKCQLPFRVEPCIKNVATQWYYDNFFQKCLLLVEACVPAGSGHVFESEEQCRRECASEVPVPDAPVPHTPVPDTPVPQTPVPDAPVPDTPALDQCRQPAAPGPCRAEFRKWYYDHELEGCRQFVYGGCGGNLNRFDSEAECDAGCGTRRNSEPTPPADHRAVSSTEHTPNVRTDTACRRDDELDAFGRYVASSLRKLDDKLTVNALNEIQATLTKFKLKNLKKASH